MAHIDARITRKSLNTVIREAAERQGITVTAVITDDGRLAYRFGEGTAVYTPGDTAHKLGVSEW